MINTSGQEVFVFFYRLMPIAFSLVTCYLAFYFLKMARNIEDTPRSRIRSAAQGYVELSGTVKPLLSQPVLGKLTQSPCGWYRYTIEKYTYTYVNGKRVYSWEPIDNGISSDPFILDDGTGECVIFPEGASVMPVSQIVWRDVSAIPSPPPKSFSFWRSFYLGFFGSYRFTEYRLELDSTLFASGIYNTWDKNDHNMSNNPELQLYLTEKNTPVANVLSRNGLSKNQNYILSSIPEGKLIRNFKLKALMFFILFLLFLAWSVSTIPSVKGTFQKMQLLQSDLVQKLFR